MMKTILYEESSRKPRFDWSIADTLYITSEITGMIERFLIDSGLENLFWSNNQFDD